MYLLLFLFLLAGRSQQVLYLGFERGLKPLPTEFRVIIIKINLTTNYQLLLNCNKVHRAHTKTPLELSEHDLFHAHNIHFLTYSNNKDSLLLP
jgi:hypothetical protein